MNDPVTAVFTVVFKFLTWLACLAVDGMKHLFFTSVTSSNATPVALAQPQLE